MTKEQILQYYQQDYIDGLVNKYPEVEITTLIQLNIEIKALYFKYVAMVELFLKGFLTKQLFIDQTTEDVEVISTFISDQKKVIKYLKSINIPNYKKLNKAQWLTLIDTLSNEQIMLIIQHLKPEYLIKIQEYFEITDSSLVKTWIALIFVKLKNYLINHQCFLNVDLDAKIDPRINEKDIKQDANFSEFSYVNTVLNNLCKVHNLLPSNFNEEYEYFIDNFIPKQQITTE